MYTFDGINKTITLDPGVGSPFTSITLDVKDMYSSWKNWVASGNAVFYEAFTTVGGEDIGGGQTISPYFFLTNGWKIKPPEEDTIITVTGGNLATDDSSYPFLPTTGNFTVQINYVVSSNSITSSGNATAQQDIRNAMALDPTVIPAADSIDAKIQEAITNALIAAGLSA